MTNITAISCATMLLNFTNWGVAHVFSSKSCSHFFHALYVPAFLMKKLGIKRKTAFGAPKASRLHGLLGMHFGWKAALAEEALRTSRICACAKDPQA